MISSLFIVMLKFRQLKALSHYALFHSRFLFFSRFITHVFDTNMLVSKMQVKMQVKMQEKIKKITQCEKNARKFVYIRHARVG